MTDRRDAAADRLFFDLLASLMRLTPKETVALEQALTEFVRAEIEKAVEGTDI